MAEVARELASYRGMAVSVPDGVIEVHDEPSRFLS
jgi:hypothetical protein